MKMENENLKETIADFNVDCLSSDSNSGKSEQRQVVREEPLTIEIKDVGTYTLMCSPNDRVAMAVGFAFSEGLIDKREDINILMKCPDDPQVIRMQLARIKPTTESPRNLLIVSSCGICGSKNIDQVIDSLPVAGDSLRIGAKELTELPHTLQQHQEIFRKTGRTHAAALFRDGKMVALAE